MRVFSWLIPPEYHSFTPSSCYLTISLLFCKILFLSRKLLSQPMLTWKSFCVKDAASSRIFFLNWVTHRNIQRSRILNPGKKTSFSKNSLYLLWSHAALPKSFFTVFELDPRSIACISRQQHLFSLSLPPSAAERIWVFSSRVSWPYLFEAISLFSHINDDFSSRRHPLSNNMLPLHAWHQWMEPSWNHWQFQADQSMVYK